MLTRPAVAGDAAALSALFNREIRETLTTFRSVERTVAETEAEIAAKSAAGHAFLVAERDGVLLGLATYGQFRGNDGYRSTMEHSILLTPEARGQGLGRRLMTALEDHAAAAGYRSLIAGVSGANPAGIAFHRAIGFAEVAVLPEVGFKDGRWLDLVLMQKRLPGSAAGGPGR